MIQFRPLLAVSLVATIMTGVHANAATVYIPSGSAGSIFVVDSETGKIRNRWDGFEAIHGLGGAPGSKYIVAGSFAEFEQSEVANLSPPDGMSETDHEAHHVKKARPLIGNETAISLLSVIDPKDGKVIKRVEVPGAVHHVAVSPDGRHAVATHPSGDSISVVNLQSLELVATIPTGSLPNYAVFGDDPTKVYVSNTGNGTVSEVDLLRGIVLQNFVAGDGPEHLVFDGDARRLFVADADAGFVTEVPLDPVSVVRRFEIGGQIHGIGLSDSGEKLFVAAKETNQLSVIDLTTGSTSYASLSPQPYHLTTIGGTKRIFVSSRQEPKVWVLRQSDLAVVNEMSIEGEGHQMVVLP